jgi:hypothetical protein
MPKTKQDMKQDTKMIDDAAQSASDGTRTLASLTARFLDAIEDAGLAGKWQPDQGEHSYTFRGAAGPDVHLQLQIDNNRLEVTLYGRPAEHRRLHGDECAFAGRWKAGRTASWARTYVSSRAQMLDMREHAEHARKVRLSPRRRTTPAGEGLASV